MEQPTTTRSGVPEASEVPKLDLSAVLLDAAAAAASAQPEILPRGKDRKTM